MLEHELRIIFEQNVRCYHSNYSDEYINKLSLEGSYRNMHPTDRNRWHNEAKKYINKLEDEKKDFFKV